MEKSKWSGGVANGVDSGVASVVVGLVPNGFSTSQSTTTLTKIKVQWMVEAKEEEQQC